jgi:hypothetical protein
MPLREEPTVYLGHKSDSSLAFGFVWVGVKDHYRTSAHQVRRPAAGETVVELRCAICDTELLLRVRSLEFSQRVRKRCLVTALVGLAITLLAFAVGFITESAGAPIPLSTAIGTILVTAIPVGIVTFGVGAYGWRNEASVRLYTTDDLPDETHRLFDQDSYGYLKRVSAGSGQGSVRVSHTMSPRSSVVTWSRSKPILSRTRKDAMFQVRTVDQSRLRPVAIAASSTAWAASVA